MPGERMRRIDKAVQQVLAEVMAGELSDPRVGFATVTGVRTSPDLRHADVYVSVLGVDAEREQTLLALQKAHGYFQRRVAQALRIKHTPTLKFHYDDTADRGMRIERILGAGEL